MRHPLWTDKEIEYLKNNLYTQGVHFCASELNRSPKGVRLKIKKLGMTLCPIKKQYAKSVLEDIVKKSRTLTDVARFLNIGISGSSQATIKKHIKMYSLDTSHFSTPQQRASVISKKALLSDYLIEGNLKYSTAWLKEKLYNAGIKNRKCEICGQGEVWGGKRMSLILDHVNGDHSDCRIDNLRVICPNCNATLETHCRGKKRLEKQKERQKEKAHRKEINAIKNRSPKINLRKVVWPSFAQLKKDIMETNFRAVGRKYGVSDNAVRKWVKSYQKEELKNTMRMTI